MKKLTALFALTASPALAASGPFFSLQNTNFVVLLAFILFIVVLAYFKVPGMLGGMLDKRAEGIRDELEKAKALREEAQTILASYERKQQEVKDQSARIVEHAKEEAQNAAKQAKADLEASIARRLQAAQDQIASAEAGAVRQVRDRAISVAIAAAADVISKKMDAASGNALIDDAIKQVEAKLH
ncbi:F0F1 ATP synthase subunit B [Actibacterium sp. XHP0104]|uniref:F0F1 ATP synthase subunit B n=1 Tax=Actibacterium sp. XHP0104 TaxID=2984335 RepID=UPI0021E8FCAE|nr:F0F1 ATP synthase subunit B [Actibacterium sp. XHP0104]MCV2882343.1 F0F1 ATP synthase subunit B [Actibacterium sp. XHP0104]